MVKKSGEDFDVPMGRYESAGVLDLGGLYILNKIVAVIPQEHFGPYCDDGLAVVHGSNYINVKSNHTPCIKRDLPNMVEKLLSDSKKQRAL
jgi:hypothetical protein